MTAEVLVVRAELPGQIWQLLVTPGQPVAATDVVLVLETMKMEVPVLAGRAGTIGRVHVAVGAFVQEDDVLLEVQP